MLWCSAPHSVWLLLYHCYLPRIPIFHFIYKQDTLFNCLWLQLVLRNVHETSYFLFSLTLFPLQSFPHQPLFFSSLEDNKTNKKISACSSSMLIRKLETPVVKTLPWRKTNCLKLKEHRLLNSYKNFTISTIIWFYLNRYTFLHLIVRLILCGVSVI